MNHASISPDGNLLVAVGDEGPTDRLRAFFCQRVLVRSLDVQGKVGSFLRYEWHKYAEPRLGYPTTGGEEEGCFCSAFSPSGHICAVASQSGYLTFFDTSLIRDGIEIGEAVIAVLKSSRPSLYGLQSPGSIRSMSFSPLPWDLLAWGEDQDRVCVVDLRDVFQSRQIIDLQPDSSDLKRADIEDYDSASEQRQLEIERRFVERHREALEAQDHLAAVSHTADYLELAAERRRIEHEAIASREALHTLSPSERQMIDSIGIRRFRETHLEHSDNPSTAPQTTHYSSNRLPELQNWTGLPSPTPSSNINSINEYMRQRNWERSRASDRSFQPRRRSSVIISNSNSTNPSSNLAPIGTATPTLSASPSRLPTNSSDMAVPHLFDASDPWQTISDAMGSPNMPADTMARLRGLQSRNMERRLQAAGTPQATIDRRMQALQRSRNEHAEAMEAITNRARESNARARVRASRADAVYEEIEREVSLRRMQQPSRGPSGDEGVFTMGIGWSVDGRNL